ncbi:MAG: hypothetical protein ACI861_000696 [Paracoccaceae bacterium]|jgi:hypothetical protein
MTVRYWIGVVASDHVDAAVKSGICAFSHGDKASLAKLSEGDRFAFYSPKTGYKSGEPVQCFTALGTIIDPTPAEFSWEGNDIWAVNAAYAKITPTSVRPLLEPLKFVLNATRWGMAFRRGHFEITEPDFALIEAALKAKI